MEIMLKPLKYIIQGDDVRLYHHIVLLKI
jgi:hypothetical protein